MKSMEIINDWVHLIFLHFDHHCLIIMEINLVCETVILIKEISTGLKPVVSILYFAGGKDNDQSNKK